MYTPGGMEFFLAMAGTIVVGIRSFDRYLPILLYTKSGEAYLQWVFGFFVGIVGNLVDRLRLGYVIDF